MYSSMRNLSVNPWQKISLKKFIKGGIFLSHGEEKPNSTITSKEMSLEQGIHIAI